MYVGSRYYTVIFVQFCYVHFLFIMQCNKVVDGITFRILYRLNVHVKYHIGAVYIKIDCIALLIHPSRTISSFLLDKLIVIFSNLVMAKKLL